MLIFELGAPEALILVALLRNMRTTQCIKNVTTSAYQSFYYKKIILHNIDVIAECYYFNYRHFKPLTTDILTSSIRTSLESGARPNVFKK